MKHRPTWQLESKLYGTTDFIVEKAAKDDLLLYDRELFEVLPDATPDEVELAEAAPLMARTIAAFLARYDELTNSNSADCLSAEYIDCLEEEFGRQIINLRQALPAGWLKGEEG